jgi:hypothetical protein
MNNIPMTGADPLGGLGREGLAVAGGLALLFALPLLALVAVLGGMPAGGHSSSTPPPAGAADTDIPRVQLAVMQAVARETGIPWQVLAAIAKVESDFGRNMATSSAGAIGYGQFLPSTWTGFGRGGDPYDYRDVIPAMARYLLAHGAPADLRRAIYAYNHSWAYVDQVLGLAAAYGLGPAGAWGTGERALAAALAQRGKPYLFGAAGPDAFDCSGLVQWAYRQVGVLAPRTAQQQFDWARPVQPAEVRVGDLAFFHSTYPSPDRITHVGIYAGNGQFVVAPAAGEVVRLESLNQPYWRALRRLWEVARSQRAGRARDGCGGDAGDSGDAGGAVVRNPRGRAAALVVGVLAGGLLALALLSGWQGAARLAGREDERAQVAAAARMFAEAYGTFDFRTPDVYREQLLALTTGTLRTVVVASETDPVALAQQRRTATRVIRAQVTALAAGQATVAVTAKQQRWGRDANTGLPLSTAVQQRIVCRLLREQGRWVVAEVRIVAEEPATTDQTT